MWFVAIWTVKELSAKSEGGDGETMRRGRFYFLSASFFTLNCFFPLLLQGLGCLLTSRPGRGVAGSRALPEIGLDIKRDFLAGEAV